MKKLKVGETQPQLSKEAAEILHDKNCKCDKKHIVKKPCGRTEEIKFLSDRFFDYYNWSCLACEWESQLMKTRII
jgi:hypothetical protein